MNIKKLLSKMTVEEKVAQLCSLMARDLLEDGKLSPAKMKKRLRHGIGFVASLTRDFPPAEGVAMLNTVQDYLQKKTRLGIPAVMLEECIHGNMAMGATIFPQSIGMGATWDPDFYATVATAIAREARARGFALSLSPTINIANDPRCGRTEETYGEDPLLATKMGLAHIRAMQKNGVACTAKHFAANFAGDGGRDSHDIHYSELELREVYFPAFEAAVRQGRVAAFMPAYNTLNGIPCSCNSWLLIDILRKEWGFQGVTGSDYWALNRMIDRQFAARNLAACARRCITGGLDVEWPNSLLYPELIREVRAGRVSMNRLNQSVARVLRLKERFAVFTQPKADLAKALDLSDGPANRALSLEAARRSMVLLRNKGLLPLRNTLRKVAVIGPNANAVRTGGYSSKGVKVITPLDGLRQALGKDHVLFAQGVTNTGGTDAGIRKAVQIAKKADAVILCMGNWSGGSWVKKQHTEGEGRDRSSLKLPGRQEELIREVSQANKNAVVVIIGGSAVVTRNWINHVKAALVAWYPGCDGGTAIAETLLGKNNPGGKLPLTFPKSEGSLPFRYNMKPTGRRYDYNDLRGSLAEFSFGHGLSYTTFKYSRLKVQKESRSTIRIGCTVRNTGRRTGDEVVQLYIHQKYTTLSRPLQELRAFRRITLAPGRSARVEFTLGRKELSYPDPKGKLVFEKSDLDLMIGSSSSDIHLTESIHL